MGSKSLSPAGIKLHILKIVFNLIKWNFLVKYISSSPICIFIYSFVYISMESWKYFLYIIWVVIEFYIILLALIVPSLAISRSVKLVTMSLLFLSTSLLSGSVRSSRLILYFPCSSTRISYFSKELWVFLLESGV